MTRQARQGLVVEGRVEASTEIAVFLRPWRRRDGRLSNEPLHVRLSLGQQMPIGAFVAVRVSKPVKVPIVGGGRVTRGSRPIRRMKPDPEIAAWETRSVAPLPAYDNAVLGRLVLARDGSLRGERSWGDATYETAIEIRDFDDAKLTHRDVKKGCTSILRTEQRLPKILDRVTVKLHPLYDKVWRGDRHRYTANDFRAMLRLSAISVRDDRTTVWLRIGSLFEDHGIEVRLARGRIAEIGLA